MNTFTFSRLAVFTTVGALAWGACTVAQAMTLRELRTLENTEAQGDLYARYYLVGVMEGVLEAHAQRERQAAAPTLCLHGRRLEPGMARSLLDGELRRNQDLYEADMPVQLVMTQALAAAYPCE